MRVFECLSHSSLIINLLKHFILVCFVGTLTSVNVTGYSGHKVNIACTYESTDQANFYKYFCKSLGTTCSDLIRTKEKDKWVDSGRFSLFYDRKAAVFNVTIRDLREQDSGTYWCGVDKTTAKDSYTEVNLKVISGE